MLCELETVHEGVPALSPTHRAGAVRIRECGREADDVSALTVIFSRLRLRNSHLSVTSHYQPEIILLSRPRIAGGGGIS